MSKIYFASDFHLGVDARVTSSEREQQLIRWLNHVAEDADEIYLVGDLFDFYFEYKRVVPRGHVRLLGTLGNLVDNGLPITLFTGNHDMWIFNYFEDELGIKTLREPVVREWDNHSFYIGHGDGLGPGDHGYKFIKQVFANPVSQWLFARLHPNFGIWMAEYWSGKSRHASNSEERWTGADEEWLVQFCEDYLKVHPSMDYFIFGHRHLPIQYQLSNGQSQYINLGEWMRYNSYGVWDGEQFELLFWENEPVAVQYS